MDSTEPHPTHTYTSTGQFVASLRITDSNGAGAAGEGPATTHYIVERDDAPSLPDPPGSLGSAENSAR